MRAVLRALHYRELERSSTIDPLASENKGTAGPSPANAAATQGSALYPKDSEEKRLLDAMLLAMPR